MGLLVSLAVVRQALPRLASVADAEVNRLIAEASDLIESYCRTTFGPGPTTEDHTLDGSGRVFLRNTPLVSVTSVTVGLPDSPRVLTTDEYQVDLQTGELCLWGSNGYFTPNPPWWGWDLWGWNTVRVVTVGPATVPAAVAGRCLAIIGRLASSLTVNTGIKSKTAGAVSVTYADASAMTLADDDRRILSPYRHYSL